MKKATSLLIVFFVLTGCAETVALLGPASSLMGGGNIIQSSATSAVDYGIKKKTGKGALGHIIAYAEEKNPDKIKDRCISFVKKTESEACYIAKKQISTAKNAAVKKIKKVVAPSKNKKIAKPLKIKAVKNIKTEQTSLLQVKVKKNIPVKGNQLRSVESIIVETALSKKQISHLRVSIEKRSRIKDLSK